MRPRIICHMLSSVDGRLLVDRFSPPAPGISDSTLRGHYDTTHARLETDGWIVGRKTMSEMSQATPPAPSDTAALPRVEHLGDRRERPLAICVDPDGRVHYDSDELDGDHIVTLLGEQVSDAYLATLRELGVSYFFAGHDGLDLQRGLELLRKTFGVKTLSLQGGATINGAFLKAGLIDELSILIYPGLDGLSGVPSIFEHPGAPGTSPAHGQSLRHIGTETLEGGMIWLRYAVERHPAS